MISIDTGITIIDPLIADGLSGYILERCGGMNTAVYTDPSRITGRIRSDVILISSEALNERLTPLLEGRIFILSDEEIPGIPEKNRLPRFIPADELMGKLFNILLREDITVSGMKNPLLNKDIVVFFSPHGYEFLGEMACEYARVGDNGGRTLLMDVRAYTPGEAGSGDDMGNLIYYLRTGTLPVDQILSACVREKDGYMYVEPFREPRDMEDITEKDFSSLVNRIAGESDYDKVVMVLPDRPFGVDVLLDNCKIFYSVSLRGNIYESYENSFKRSLDAASLKKLYELKVPESVHSSMLAGDTAGMNELIIKLTGG